MRLRACALGMLLLVGSMTSGSAAVRIAGDNGGRVGTYIDTFTTLHNSGQNVVIDGACLSACTLVLGLIPSDQLCVTPRARLGFHAAWRPDDHGRPVLSAMGTLVLMDVYPPKIRNWIRRKGGLSQRMTYLHGRELRALYRPCR